MPAKKRGRSRTYLTPSPSPRELSPQPITSALGDRDTHSAMTTSRPSSLAFLSAALSHPPSLHEILSNTAPPPYTLAAFMAFLSQNHCLETLEFTMDAERYTSAYCQMSRMTDQNNWTRETHEQLCSLWQKLMTAYLLPYAPRELNLPAPVRDRLLGLPCQSVAPHPSELDEAVRIVYELMNDSVMGPFLASVATPSYEELAAEEAHSARQGRTKLHISHDSASGRREEASRSPKTSFLPLFGIHRGDSGHHSGSSSVDSPELGLTDDTDSMGSPRDEPMTPPTTPPTSDWGFSASPGTLQRAINAHNTGWKRMSEKLGLKSKSGRSKRSNDRSITSGVPNTEGSSSHHS
jgi:hypothetical protein